MRTLLRPRWLAWHLTVALLLVVLGLLGRWQMTLYVASHRAAPPPAGPVALTSLTTPGTLPPAAALGRSVSVTGHYDAAHQLLVAGRSSRGRIGYDLLTPLLTADGDVVPVVRGWVQDPQSGGTQVPVGTVTVTGLLQPPETTQDALVQDARLPAGQVGYAAATELLRTAGYPVTTVFGGLVYLTDQTPPQAASTPPDVPGDPSSISPWRLITYAIQWWVFGLALLLFWAYTVRDQLRGGWAARRRRGEPGGPAGAGGGDGGGDDEGGGLPVPPAQPESTVAP